jgi:urease accessory protein
MLLQASATSHGIAAAPGAGYVRAVRTAARGTVLTHLRADSPLRLFCPNIVRGSAWVVTTTLGGGLVGGDDIDLSIDVEAGATVLLTTQASTRIYRSTRRSSQHLTARVGPRATLVVLPDPTLAFAGSSFDQEQRYELDDDATIVVLDWLASGRQASGERWAFDHYSSRLRIVRDGKPVFVDHLRLSQTDGRVADRLRRHNSFATAVAIGPGVMSWVGDVVSAVSSQGVDANATMVGSASTLTRDRGIVLRLAGEDVETLGAMLRELLRPIERILDVDPWMRRW